MVGFGRSLKRSRRQGWEAAYLDYNKLKRILYQLERSMLNQSNVIENRISQNDDAILGDVAGRRCHQINEEFYLELGQEIEKISLFTLKIQGLLSEAIGYYRFRDDDTIKVAKLFPDNFSISREHYNGIPGDDLEMCLILGVELLFLMQFVGVNILGVRKVMKKYNKIIRRANKPEYIFIVGGKDDFHLELIANSQSLSAIHSSLQSLLVDFHCKYKLLTKDTTRELNFFRFQSIVQAGYVIQKNSEIVNQPFKEFLSRKAMINVGSSLGGIEGNEMHAVNVVLSFRPIGMLTSDFDELDGMWIRCMGLALTGRFLCGFGSAEVVNRQLISTCVSFKQITRASAFFVAAGAMGMSVGPLIAAILDDTTGRDYLVDFHLPFTPAGGIIFNSVTSPGFLMAILWLAELLCLIFYFCEPERVNAVEDEFEEVEIRMESLPLMGKDYGSIGDERISNTSIGSSNLDLNNNSNRSSSPEPLKIAEGFWGGIISACSLICVNQGLPVTLVLFCYIELVDEVLISSCSMIVRRYFGWNASAAGYLVACLGGLVLPVEIFSRRLSERFIMKVSIWFIIVCGLGMFNYQGLYYDMIGISKYGEFDPIDEAELKELQLSGMTVGQLFADAKEFPYDWNYGVMIYITFLSFTFAGTIVLEGVTTSIMAQATPPKLNTCFVNSGLLATLIGTLGRVLSDSMITMAALLDIHVFIDFVNATFFPLIILTAGCLILVYKYYDKLV
ncbi:unnamed protein product [Pseudo-nitzschia multistriata]|uniref:SPX domain-containing protein n=1 Tax=Pseudo-nitzschia multistriata TaxID=183589 RepID=A0A448Z3W1_9STRA|nr:unnamed protein product [Pseudo-nitzschia multistriata]